MLRGGLVALSWALLATPAAALLATSAAATPALHVIPFPGTPDASSLSQVILSSVRPSQVRSVTVAGSASGIHSGHRTALPDGAGTAFAPDHPFTAGEHVEVTAVLNSPAAGTASGDPGATRLTFSFTIATPAAVPATAGQAPATVLSGDAFAHVSSGDAFATASSGDASAQVSSGNVSAQVSFGGASAPVTSSQASAVRGARATPASPAQSFRSAPGLRPPVVSATSDPDSAAGDIFLSENDTSHIKPIQNGLMILDRRAQLVWFRPLNGWATNLQVAHYGGRPVLTWFQQTYGQTGGNEDVIMNRSYRTVATLHAGDGYVPDMHEFQLTPQGTALIDAYARVNTDMSSIGGPANGAVLDCIVQELDVRTGRVLWEWHSLGHVPLSATRYPGQKGWPPYDYFHLNSIQQLPNGNLLISARNTWAVYEIDKQTGRVIWTLGGRDSSFKIGPGANFEWQHDARLSGDTLSLFDDGALPQEERQSSAKVLRLDTGTMTASLSKRYTHSPPVLSGIEGSTQLLPDHNVFVGWGNQPLFSEYTAAGKQIFAASLASGTHSYRAYRFPWIGRPATRPALAMARQSGGALKAYVSWNGATQVAAWRVRGGSRPGALSALASAARTGFETTITLPHPPRYLAVQALNARGKVIGTSLVRKV